MNGFKNRRMPGHAGAGVYCQEFAHYIPIGAERTAFEGEVNWSSTSKPNPWIHSFNQVVILVDLKVAIQAVSSNITTKMPLLQNADRC